MNDRMARKVNGYFQRLTNFKVGQQVEVKPDKVWCGKSAGSRGTIVPYQPARIGHVKITRILAVKWDGSVEPPDWGMHMDEKLRIVK